MLELGSASEEVPAEELPREGGEGQVGAYSWVGAGREEERKASPRLEENSPSAQGNGTRRGNQRTQIDPEGSGFS